METKAQVLNLRAVSKFRKENKYFYKPFAIFLYLSECNKKSQIPLIYLGY
jgi:hypothetical protein